MPPLNLIGPQVRRLRYKAGWSQEMLALKLQLAGFDVSRGTVAKIESRIVWVGDWHLYYFARVFKVSIVDLLPPLDPLDPTMHERVTKYMERPW